MNYNHKIALINELEVTPDSGTFLAEAEISDDSLSVSFSYQFSETDTLYEFNITVTDENGILIDNDWAYIYEPFALTSIAPEDGTIFTDNFVDVTLNYNHKIALINEFEVTSDSGTFLAEPEISNDSLSVFFSYEFSETDTLYEFNITVTDVNGISIDNDWSYIYEPFDLISIVPEDGTIFTENSVEVTINYNRKLESINELEVTPDTGTFITEADLSDDSLSVFFTYQFSETDTLYEFNITVTDVNGIPIDNDWSYTYEPFALISIEPEDGIIFVNNSVEVVLNYNHKLDSINELEVTPDSGTFITEAEISDDSLSVYFSYQFSETDTLYEFNISVTDVFGIQIDSNWSYTYEPFALISIEPEDGTIFTDNSVDVTLIYNHNIGNVEELEVTYNLDNYSLDPAICTITGSQIEFSYEFPEIDVEYDFIITVTDESGVLNNYNWSYTYSTNKNRRR